MVNGSITDHHVIINVNIIYLDMNCQLEEDEWLTSKLLLICVLGSVIGLFGVFGNVTTAVIMTRPAMRSPNNLLLAALALYDTCLLITAFMLYSIEYIVEYTHSYTLRQCWLTYVRAIYALSHISETGSVYMTMAATSERLIAVILPNTHQSWHRWHSAMAMLTVLAVSVFAILFNCTKYFEVLVIRNLNCSIGTWQSYTLKPSDMAMDISYSTIYTLWTSNIVMVFLPFILLTLGNTIVALNLRINLKNFRTNAKRKLGHVNNNYSNRNASMNFDLPGNVKLSFGKGSVSWNHREKLKEHSREATQILVVVVILFLLCNLWGVVLNVLEKVIGEDNLILDHRKLYEFSRVFINLLAIINSSMNFFIYWIFGEDFREQFFKLFGCEYLLKGRDNSCVPDAAQVQDNGIMSNEGSCALNHVNSDTNVDDTNHPHPEHVRLTNNASHHDNHTQANEVLHFASDNDNHYVNLDYQADTTELGTLSHQSGNDTNSIEIVEDNAEYVSQLPTIHTNVSYHVLQDVIFV